MGKKDKGRKVHVEKVVVPEVELEYLPADQKRKWILNDGFELAGSYLDLLAWVRQWATREGIDWSGIRSCRSNETYPLIQVSVSIPLLIPRVKVKFLISKSSLFLLAFHCPQIGWLVFRDSEFKIKTEQRITFVECSPNYTNKEVVMSRCGLPYIIKSMKSMCSLTDHNELCQACETFFVHICEASRLRLVQNMIVSTMIPRPAFNKKLYEPKSDESDMMKLLSDFRVDWEFSTKLSPEAQTAVTRFKQLCRAWIRHSLGEGGFTLESQIATDCKITSLSILKESLCLLCNANVRKIVEQAAKDNPKLLEKMMAVAREKDPSFEPDVGSGSGKKHLEAGSGSGQKRHEAGSGSGQKRHYPFH